MYYIFFSDKKASMNGRKWRREVYRISLISSWTFAQAVKQRSYQWTTHCERKCLHFLREKNVCFFKFLLHLSPKIPKIQYFWIFQHCEMYFCIHLYCILKDFKSRYLGIDAKYIQAHIITTRYAKKETKKREKAFKEYLNFSTLKPRYSEQVCQTLFVHYIE